MARLTPVEIPAGVDVSINEQLISVKCSKGTLEHNIHTEVEVTKEGNVISFASREGVSGGPAQSGTARAVIGNMLTGVSQGFEKKLLLVGVGYRAQAQGKVLNLTLGFSHPVNYELPEGISAVTLSQTEIVVSGIERQKVGQVAADIRAFRPPEPYKGKGVRFVGEQIRRKAGKSAAK